MFGGRLPRVPILFGNAKGYLGQCLSTKQRRPGGKTAYTNFRLRFSLCHDLSQDQWEDTLIHEMIHLYIGVNKLKDSSAHGPLFRQMMDSINQRFGRHLAISHHSSAPDSEQSPPPSSRLRAHVVAHVHLRDGRQGIKVLPRVEESVVRYYTNVLSSPEVSSIDLYMACDPYFERFPNSSVFRVHFLPPSEILAHLQQAEPMQCDGRRVIRHRGR